MLTRDAKGGKKSKNHSDAFAKQPFPSPSSKEMLSGSPYLVTRREERSQVLQLEVGSEGPQDFLWNIKINVGTFHIVKCPMGCFTNVDICRVIVMKVVPLGLLLHWKLWKFKITIFWNDEMSNVWEFDLFRYLQSGQTDQSGRIERQIVLLCLLYLSVDKK